MLTEKLASEIVKRTMSIINKNINIMDHTGTIIASGDASRFGQLHAGAQRVIEKQLTVEINSMEKMQWHGSLPGINLPIRFQGEIVGVIGITGEPSQIRSQSRLVQMGAELTLEQAFLTNEIQRNKRIRYDFLASILLGVETRQDSILERSYYLNVNIQKTVGVILISPHMTNESFLEKVKSEVKLWLNKDDEYIELFTNQYIILKREPADLNAYEKLKSFIETTLTTSALSNVTVAIGSFSKGIQGWRQSYEEAQNVKEVAEILYPAGEVWDHNDLEMALLCNRLLKNSNRETEKMLDRYKRLFQENDGKVLHETLITFIHENGKVGKTAEKLFIHRNTLSYRLDKIHTMTGKDPKSIRGLSELMITQLLYFLTPN